MNALARTEVFILPALAMLGFLFPGLLWRTWAGPYYVVCMVSALMVVHGLVVLFRRRDFRYFTLGALVIGAFVAASFFPIWFVHAAPTRAGWERHGHIFWVPPHQH